MKDCLLIIFVKNPVLGQVKTRLASEIGEEQALHTYQLLLERTASITQPLNIDKVVYYSFDPLEKDHFNAHYFNKKRQINGDLGEKMKHAFNENFTAGYKLIVIIGSDCAELESSDIVKAYDLLNSHDSVLGPAKDGGYYLLGLKKPFDRIFENKIWSTSSVLEEAIQDLEQEKLSYAMLKELSDIDTLEDLNNSPYLTAKLSSQF